jgi:hypothetical protein
MDKNPQDTSSPQRPSPRRMGVLAALAGAVGGVALFFGIGLWYFTRVDPHPRSQPGAGSSAKSRDLLPSVANDEVLVMETDAVDIVPLSEMHVNLKSGTATSVEVPEGSGLTAKVEGNSVKVVAAKDAKEGMHQVIVKDGKGKQTAFKVNIKK